jgi:hypothetical protein
MLVGVPLITPDEVLKVNPVLFAKSGLIDHEVIGPPPDAVAILFEIGEFKVYDGDELEYEILPGTKVSIEGVAETSFELELVPILFVARTI